MNEVILMVAIFAVGLAFPQTRSVFVMIFLRMVMNNARHSNQCLKESVRCLSPDQEWQEERENE
jgi:hypothetical protein